MTSIPQLATTRTFGMEDQHWFARLSGDRNPMHLDPVAARRTQAGTTVVHGIHLLLWLLDVAARLAPDAAFVGSLKVRFDRFVGVGEEAVVVITQLDETVLRGEVRVGAATAARVAFQFAAPADAGSVSHGPAVGRDEAADLTLDEMATMHGVIAALASPAALAEAFPDAARAVGLERLGGLIGSTYLVGMVCPGLHSIYGGLSLVSANPVSGDQRLAFCVSGTDPRFRAVKMDVRGAGWTGTVNAFARQPPVMQPGLVDLRRFVGADAFAGRHAFVAGGSRGLGELVAKLIAAGGGAVTISYVAGRDDAERVAGEIAAAGGRCDTIRLDVRDDIDRQLSDLPAGITSFYHMATPTIFGGKGVVFDQARLDDFMRFYVTGFWSVSRLLATRNPALAVFYPSSISVHERPAGMTEYAMAKAAGELLCADMAASFSQARIIQARLPRLSTDQTASLQQVEVADATVVILEQIRLTETGHRPA